MMKLMRRMRISNPLGHTHNWRSGCHYAVAIPSKSRLFQGGKVTFPLGSYTRCYIKKALPKDTLWVLRDKSNAFNTFCYVWITYSLEEARALKKEHDSHSDTCAELTHPVPYAHLY